MDETRPLLGVSSEKGSARNASTYDTVRSNVLDHVEDRPLLRKRRETYRTGGKQKPIFQAISRPILTRKNYFLVGEGYVRTKGFCEQAWSWIDGIIDMNPILKGTLTKISSEFGGAIATVFYDWRWISSVNLVVFLVWGVLVLWPWFQAPPRFADSVPPQANFWHRDDLDVDSMLTLLTGAKSLRTNSTLVADSFLFYSGYTPKIDLGGSRPYRMGPAWVGACLLSVVLICAMLNQRLWRTLRLRRVDPEVRTLVSIKASLQEEALAAKGFKLNQNAHEDTLIGQAAQELIFGGFDHSAHNKSQQMAQVVAVGLKTLSSTHYSRFTVPAALQVPGVGVYECLVTATGWEKHRTYHGSSPTREEGAGVVSLSEVCPSAIVYARCEDTEHGASRALAGGEAAQAFVQYCEVNPAARSEAAGDGEEGSLFECILRYGALSKVSSSKGPGGGEGRSSFVVGVHHGMHETVGERCRQVVGITLTIGFFLVSAYGVYVCAEHQPEIQAKYGPYAVNILLILIQSAIPKVVRKIVDLEKWSSKEEELQQTLGRVYTLKMANLVVLLQALNHMLLPDNVKECPSLDIGLFLYQQVLIGSLANSLSAFGSMWAKSMWYEYLGRGRPEFDGQSVAFLYIDLNYQTALCWVGMIFCPVLPLLFAVLNFAQIWWQIAVLRWFCKCSDKPFKTGAESRIMVMLIFMVTFAYSCIPTLRFLYAYPQSSSLLSYCGPFSPDSRRWTVLMEYLVGAAPSVNDALIYVSNPLLLVGVVLLMALICQYERAERAVVTEECADQYMNIANQQRHLRQSRLKVNQLEAEKQGLLDKVLDLEDSLNNAAALGVPLQTGSSARGLGPVPHHAEGEEGGPGRPPQGTGCWG